MCGIKLVPVIQNDYWILTLINVLQQADHRFIFTN